MAMRAKPDSLITGLKKQVKEQEPTPQVIATFGKKPPKS